MAQRATNDRQAEPNEIYRTVLLQVALVLVTRILSHLSHTWQNQLNSRLQSVFALHVLKARLQCDLPTLESVSMQRELRTLTAGGSYSADRGWRALQSLIHVATSVVETIASSFVLWGASFCFAVAS